MAASWNCSKYLSKDYCRSMHSKKRWERTALIASTITQSSFRAGRNIRAAAAVRRNPSSAGGDWAIASKSAPNALIPCAIAWNSRCSTKGERSARWSDPCRKESLLCARPRRSTNHHLLLRVVEGDPLAGLNRCDRHAERDRMAVAGFDVRIGSFAAAHAFHPVAYVPTGRFIHARVRSALHSGGLFQQCPRAQPVCFHPHRLGIGFLEPAFSGNHVLVEVQRSA